MHFLLSLRKIEGTNTAPTPATPMAYVEGSGTGTTEALTRIM